MKCECRLVESEVACFPVIFFDGRKKGKVKIAAFLLIDTVSRDCIRFPACHTTSFNSKISSENLFYSSPP